MRILPRFVEHRLAPRIQRQHHADPGEHRIAIAVDRQQQGLSGGLLWLRLLRRRGKRLDGLAGILERHQLAAIGKGNRVVKHWTKTRRSCAETKAKSMQAKSFPA